MSRATTTPAGLADAIDRNLGAAVNYAPIPVNGEVRIADLVLSLV
jgi:hypothetical protein